jgi:hypothetical protein
MNWSTCASVKEEASTEQWEIEVLCGSEYTRVKVAGYTLGDRETHRKYSLRR